MGPTEGQGGDLVSDRRELERLLGRDPAAEARRAAERFDALGGSLSARIVLHGAGNLGVKVAEGLRRNGVEPLAFSDSNPASHGSSRAGLPVLAPAEAASRYGRSAVFVPSIWNPRFWYGDALSQLRALGCERVIPVQVLFWKFPGTFLPYFQIDRPEKILHAAAAVRAAFDLLRNAESRRELLQVLRWSLDLAFGTPPAPHALEDQYFPSDLRTPAVDEEFLDVGAFDGDTIEEFAARTGGTFRRIVAFEPDPTNLSRLEVRLARLPEEVTRRVEVRRVAVGATPGRIGFQSSGSGSSAVAAGTPADFVVPVVPLDSYADLAPTFVKMDVEGMELSALRGGRRLIGEYAPALAVCVYHRLEHIWEVPLAIQEIRPGYELHLRRYWEWPWEIVCYAIPRPRR